MCQRKFHPINYTRRYSYAKFGTFFSGHPWGSTCIFDIVPTVDRSSPYGSIRPSHAQIANLCCLTRTHTYKEVWNYTRFTALCPGLHGSAGTRKVKPICFLLKQEQWVAWHQLGICKSAPRSRQITTPAPHHSVFYRPDALPAAQPTASKHWRLSEIIQ